MAIQPPGRPPARLVKAVGLAASSGDPELGTLVAAYRDAHDALAHNWTQATPDHYAALRETLEAAMKRIAVLMA